ncbi:MAG TPA: hypothetical protein VGC41_10575 [Kofleriaceae bacterium]
MKTVVVLLALCGAALACGDEDPDDEHPERCVGPYQPWSVTPLVTGALAFDGKVTRVWGAELRLRHNTDTDPDALTFSLGVDSVRFQTFEPYAMIGQVYLWDQCPECQQAGKRWWALHLGLGAGANVREHSTTSFVVGRITWGLLYDSDSGTRPVFGGPAEDPGWEAEPRKRHRSQVAIVLEAKVAADGEMRVALGLELDPLRWIVDEMLFDHW